MSAKPMTRKDWLDYLQTTIDKIYEEMEAKDDPVAYINQHGVVHEAGYKWGPNNTLTALYAEPTNRTWVGLTDEHKDGLICMTDPNPEPHHLRELIDVVEFQLKGKNT